MVAHGLRLTNPQDQVTRPQGAVVAAAADAVAGNQKTDKNKKRRSFLRLFSLVRKLRNQTLRIDTYFQIEPLADLGWRESASRFAVGKPLV